MIRLLRIDDGKRAKLVCGACAAETYVLLIPDGDPLSTIQVSALIAEVGESHRSQCVMGG
jgi:hypothetical protein